MKSQIEIDTYYNVIARDSGDNGRPLCINCGAAADDVHEILPRSFFGPNKQDILFDIKNRCCLCRECHGSLHNELGKVKLMKILIDRHGYKYEGFAGCLLEKQLTRE